MSCTRRVFLGTAGLSALALAGKAALDGLARAAETPRPGAPGARWGMVIDTAGCLRDRGCTDCIAACHAVHNVPAFPDRAHEVKWIWREPFDRVFPEQASPYLAKGIIERPVLVLCNHCDNPPCVRVCPTQATWKRADGIVMMDWHRCIGCRYCVAACPYGSRSFNWLDPRPRIAQLRPDFPTRSKGVVEKCTFCEERLSQGLLPACVEACREKALVFGNLIDPKDPVRELLRTRHTIRRKPELGTHPEVHYLV
jgi:molybdopterin-containing oxidoreductase family iron-sulfur binding subunit